MKQILLSLVFLTSTLAVSAAEFPIIICDSDKFDVQYLIDMNTHSVYEIEPGKAPLKKRVLGIEDTRPSSGDTIIYKLYFDMEIALSDQGEDSKNPWSLYSEVVGSGACKGQ